MKSKNRNPRNRQLGIVLVMLILLISGMLVYGLTLSNRSIVPTSTSESMWYTNWDESTVSFMNTAIAEFTKDPTLALSSTPFYAEMVNYRVLWEHTTTPDSYRNRCPQEGCPTYVFVDPMIRTFEPVTSATWDYVATEWMKWQTMSPTPLPPPAYTLTSTPPRYTATPSATWVCSPAIANWELVEDSISFENLLKEKGIEASASLFSSGVEGIDTACHLPFQPTFSRVNLWVEVDTLDDATILPLTITILGTIEDHILEFENISPRQLAITITFNADKKAKWLWTRFDTLQKVWSLNLSAEDLVQALGGFYEGDVQQ